jgi:hypothetical protein
MSFYDISYWYIYLYNNLSDLIIKDIKINNKINTTNDAERRNEINF